MARAAIPVKVLPLPGVLGSIITWPLLLLLLSYPSRHFLFPLASELQLGLLEGPTQTQWAWSPGQSSERTCQHCPPVPRGPLSAAWSAALRRGWDAIHTPLRGALAHPLCGVHGQLSAEGFAKHTTLQCLEAAGFCTSSSLETVSWGQRMYPICTWAVNLVFVEWMIESGMKEWEVCAWENWG